MKKIIAISLTAFILCFSAPLAQAQTTQAELEAQYRQALIQVIELLMQQVRLLQRQLARMQATEYNLSIGAPVIEEAPPTPIIIPMNPEVRVTARVTRTLNPNPGYKKFETIWSADGTVKVRNENNWRQDRVDIFYSFKDAEGAICSKTGLWEGTVIPQDGWENVPTPVQYGTYGLQCGDAFDSVILVSEE